MIDGRVATAAGRLARLGFADAERSAGCVERLGDAADELIHLLAATADPDQALAYLADLADRVEDRAELLDDLVDDEELAVRRLVRMLEASECVEIAGTATDPRDAIARITDDVAAVFLDISMPEVDGFAVARRLPPGTVIVFTTAHDQHALRAFEVNALDYLVKPVRADALARALDKLARRRGGQAPREVATGLLWGDSAEPQARASPDRTPSAEEIRGLARRIAPEPAARRTPCPSPAARSRFTHPSHEVVR